jgi:hypothetical protein
MQKRHSAQRFLLVQEVAWFNVWRRYSTLLRLPFLGMIPNKCYQLLLTKTQMVVEVMCKCLEC